MKPGCYIKPICDSNGQNVNAESELCNNRCS